MKLDAISKIKDTSAQDRVKAPSSGALNTKGLWVVGSMVALGAILVLLSRFNLLLSSDQNVSKRQIQIAQVERGNLQRDISVQGRVVAANSPTIYAPATGTITILVKAGQNVGKEQTIAVIDSPELSSQLDQQKNQLSELQLEYERQKIQIKTALLDNQQAIEVAKVDLELAKKNIERAEQNIKVKVISQVEYETQQAELAKIKLQHKHAIQTAELNRENLEFELKTKEFQLQRQQYVVQDLQRQVDELKLISPLEGVVGNINVREKDTVAANSALMTLVDLTAFELEVNIPESYADDLGVGLGAAIQIDNKEIQGELTAISPEVANGQVTGRIRFIGDLPTRLRQNQRISSRILIESKNNVVKVKRGSFLESSGSRFAFVLDGDIAVKKPVQIGAYSLSEVEVVSGLDVGDQIIISSVEQFVDSQQIYLSN
ncbi:MAG: efflux RND transporter periplasmic adaptor subunit [Kangiellaceae bacterium]|nr:efflux RND transporter periplasmic adaptor subunit [Kangiellaceae bacterium]